MATFKELKVWQAARAASKQIYQLTAKFPESEKFGLVSQMRRSSISILSNIAEGSGRHSPKEFNHFISIAKGSCKELEAQLIISEDLGYIASEADLFVSIEEINKMLAGLAKSLKITATETNN